MKEENIQIKFAYQTEESIDCAHLTSFFYKS